LEMRTGVAVNLWAVLFGNIAPPHPPFGHLLPVNGEKEESGCQLRSEA